MGGSRIQEPPVPSADSFAGFREILKVLATAAPRPSAAPINRHAFSLREGANQNTKAATAAPAVIPTCRALASIPPAAPERLRGADATTTRLSVAGNNRR